MLFLWGGSLVAVEVAARACAGLRGCQLADLRNSFAERRKQRRIARWADFHRDYPYLPFTPKVQSPDLDMKGLRRSGPGRPKPPDVFRVVCLGGSTTHLGYPAMLEDALREEFSRFGLDLEVVNAGCASWTAAESLIDFTMRGLPLDPDLVIVLHGVNDAWPAFGSEYRPDYAHWRTRLIRQSPTFWDHLPGVLDYSAAFVQVRAKLEEHGRQWTWAFATMRYIPDFERDEYHGMEAFRRHMTNILVITDHWRIPTLLVTQTGNEQTPHVRLLAAMREANEITKSLSASFGHVGVVDVASIIRGTNESMHDICHLKPAAEQVLVREIGDEIRARLPEYLDERQARSRGASAGRTASAP